MKDLSQKSWRYAFWIFSIFILILMPLISKDYGQTGDESLQMEYGRDIWNYFQHGDKQALDYSNANAQHEGQQYYGGLYDYSMHVLHEWFPSIHILRIRHFFNALFGALLMIFTGLVSLRLSKKWSVAFLSLLFMFCAPRIFGESMNNPKDIPFASGFIIGIYYLLALLQDFPRRAWQHALGIALGFGVAFGVRSAGGIVQLAYFMAIIVAFYVFDKAWRAQMKADKNKLLKRIALWVIGGLAVGYVIGLLTWPWGLQSPVTNPLESLKAMSNRATTIPVLFNGTYTLNKDLPWFYEFKWLFISNPLVLIVGWLLFLALLMKIKKEYNGWLVPFLILFGALFPILYMIYKKSVVYDSWRHVFFVFPFWAIAAALAWESLGTWIRNPKLKLIPVAVAILGLLPVVVWGIKNHPNQTVYFNELVGGIRGAYNVYETDYYQNSGKQAADWIKAHAKAEPGRKIIVRSNLSGYWYYFDQDTTHYVADYGRYNNRANLDWDYFVAYGRYISTEQIEAGKWPPANTIYEVKVDGIPICVVLKRTSKLSIEANQAMEKKDYETAIQKYRTFLEADNTDENAFASYGIALASVGALDEAIGAMNSAVKLDPGRIDLLQTLAKLYQLKGDNANAQKAMSAANALIMKQQSEE